MQHLCLICGGEIPKEGICDICEAEIKVDTYEEEASNDSFD